MRIGIATANGGSNLARAIFRPRSVGVRAFVIDRPDTRDTRCGGETRRSPLHVYNLSPSFSSTYHRSSFLSTRCCELHNERNRSYRDYTHADIYRVTSTTCARLSLIPSGNCIFYFRLELGRKRKIKCVGWKEILSVKKIKKTYARFSSD